ncbi:D-alanyl-D-alanine carboxypeptidase [Clostridiaceae bacterium Marseille-Q4145]|nr:D-alanyl-D-alanine carboxypeptidase [Clostridiaceae bacterium Marseille-Q4145]
MRDYEEDQMRQRERERRRAENRKRARERQRKKRMLVMGGMGCCAVILIVAGIWLMAGRTGKAQLSEGDEKAVQEQTTEALSDSGAKTTSENETEVALQDEEQVSGEIEQSEETAPAQTSSMPFAVGYDAQETDSTTYLGSDSVQSSYALLVDLDDNTIVSQKSAYDRINPASMTKILTVLVAAEHVTDLDDTFTITKEITDFSYSHDCSAVGFLDEETVTVRDLLYGTILPSGGDAAAGLACYVAGSMDSFVNMMNEKLAELGLSDTAHFTNCVGLYDENHYCSIYDMAMILKAAVENDLAREVLTAHTYTTSATEQHPEGITISNWFLRRIEDKDTKGTVVCAKTGFVAQSGNCAASYEETDSGKHYICVTANAHSSWRCIYDHVAVYQEYTK